MIENYKLEKFDESKLEKKKVFNLIMEKLDSKDGHGLFDSIKKTYEPYLYWDKIKYKTLPAGISSSEEFWAITKFIRKTESKKSVIKNEDGVYFKWIKLPSLEEFLHEVDLNTGGNLTMLEQNIDKKDRHKFIARGSMEEAIASSQLEGANTTIKVAKKFLREGRKPKNKSEQMILNNYLAIKMIEDDYKEKKLTREILFELHSVLTRETIPEKKKGQFRLDEDEIVVGDENGMIYHEPPKMEFVEEEIDRLIAYANDELKDPIFVHPIIKAIFIHFWIGYLHPFYDGNGRLARALFYWYLLKKDYWAFAYLPISKIIKKSPGQYRDAYIYTEQDDNDLTYFVDYIIRKIKQATTDFKEYVEKKSKGNRVMNNISKSRFGFNDRQIKLLQYYHENKDESTSLKTHTNIYQISKATGIKDLKMLKEKGFITAKKDGKHVYYYPTSKIDEIVGSK